jgi:3-deoxy-D-manno-octulosonic-acid transferase
MSKDPLSLRAYRYATTALEPIAPFALRRRMRRGKENPERLPERLGVASRARPPGTLIWIHAASVGESLSVLPLIDALLAEAGRSVLVTSGTVTSAQLMAERLPRHAIHQFSPVDTPGAVARFLDHWRPRIGLFVDSEIWPNTIAAAHERGVGLAIVNGRMSEKSFTSWSKAKRMAARLFSLYEICLVQDAETASRFKNLGATSVQITGSLKSDSPPLPADPEMLADLRKRIGDRPIFLATNTHAGEDELVLGVHDALRVRFPSLLTIIVPRHPERRADIVAACGSRAVALRSRGDKPGANIDVYIADTLGELGLFYRLTGFAFIGKSLTGEGGQNPLEAARLGCVVIAGPHTANFSEAYDAIFVAQGLGRVSSPAEIETLATRLLIEPAATRNLGEAAAMAVRALGGALERTRLAVEAMLRSHART